MSASVERDLRNERIHVVDERNRAMMKSEPESVTLLTRAVTDPGPLYGQP
jgi:hypothetical protein